MPDKFFGHDINYWMELQKRAVELNAVDLLQEVADLHGRLSFIESRLSQIDSVRLYNK